ncbi:YppE family protein [Priestia flexa]|uniref:Endonuclease III n=2 Tax=Priestia TaxID=2800373 RepID=A0A0V8JLZ2_9BACI|nr:MULTISPECIES: YppE family protein [Bacillaceae]AQX55302.1 endonuclease III [Priestia flexa]KSU87869.1 endonuclease III [Priestia veravalensis]KZB89893.1 endonuclease III [Bacillus sp. VT 712]MBN8252410.1 YppE family protein [Priestia flexa]MBN8433880.1 YppE family protein [Priestia flexa]
MNLMIEATKVLHHYNELALTRLSTIKSNSEYEVNFFGEVKPYVDQFFYELDMWTDLVTKWLKETKPKYIHINQVDTLRENLQNVVLQSFYQETRDKRFKQMYQSNKYVLESILMNG